MPESTPPVRDYPLGLAPQQILSWPLTTDNLDTNGGNALVPLAGNPITAGVGFVGNGLTTKLLGTPPAWAVPTTAPVSAFCKVHKTLTTNAWNEIAFALTHSTADRPKLELSLQDDVTNPALPQYVLRMWGGAANTVYLGRAGWRFEFRGPELLNGVMPAPQGLAFLDADTLLFTCDESGTNATILYRVDVATGEYTGRARSNTLMNCNCLALDQSGDVWGVAWTVPGGVRIFKIDLATSFSTGTITEAASWTVTGDTIGPASIAFATVGGVEYVLLTEFAHTSAPRCFVFLRSKMSAAADAVADRVLKFVVGSSLQGFTQRASDGLLYASRSLDRIDTYDIAAIVTAGVDNTTPTPVTAYPAPAQRCEGLAFHPVTDRLWIGTEGRTNARRDTWSHCALWSTDLTGGEWNSFLVDFSNGQYQVRCNGRLMTVISYTPTSPPEKLVVGAAASSTVGAPYRVLVAATVKALALSDTPFTLAQLADLEAT